MSSPLRQAFVIWLKELIAEVQRPLRPYPFRLLIEEQLMGNRFGCSFQLPAIAEQPDTVTKRKINLTGTETGSEEHIVEPDAVSVKFVGLQGTTVTAELRDGDDADPINWSEPQVATLDVTDTIAPPQPGVFSGSVDEELPNA